MNLLTGKDREDAIADMKRCAVKDFNISAEQADKRVNKLVEAIDNGIFDGIGENGPADFMQKMFVEVKTNQIMTTQVD